MALGEIDANPSNNLPPSGNHRRVQHKYLIFISAELVFGSDKHRNTSCHILGGNERRKETRTCQAFEIVLSDRLHFGWCRPHAALTSKPISSYLGSKYRSRTVRARCFGASSLPSTKAS
jgi:hypothetical protein